MRADPPAPPRSRTRITTSSSPFAVFVCRRLPLSAAENGDCGRETLTGAVGAAAATRRRASSVTGVPARLAHPGRAGPDWYQRTIASGSATATSRTGDPGVAWGVVAQRQPRQNREHDHRDAGSTHDAHPAEPRIAPGPERVDECDRPGRVGEPVDVSPGAVADPPAEQARGDEQQQQVEGDRAEAEPDRPVRRENGITASLRPMLV